MMDLQDTLEDGQNEEFYNPPENDKTEEHDSEENLIFNSTIEDAHNEDPNNFVIEPSFGKLDDVISYAIDAKLLPTPKDDTKVILVNEGDIITNITYFKVHTHKITDVHG